MLQAAGCVGQGPALPAHFLYVLPAETGGSPVPAAVPRVSHPRPSQDCGGASYEPLAGAAPGGDPELAEAQQGQTDSPLLTALGQRRLDSLGGPAAAGGSIQGEARVL